MLEEVREFLEEARSLRVLLAQMPGEAWQQPTPFKRWTAWDVVAHLSLSDQWALSTLRSREDFGAEMQRVNAALASGIPITEYTRRRFEGLDGPALLAAWSTGFEALCARFGSVDPQQRFAWFGPDMAARTFVTARLMETWAHGQDVYDLLRVPRVYNDNLRSIAFLGVKTFSFTFVNRGLTPPSIAPLVSLTAPSGAIWEYNAPSDVERIEGLASDFCHVVTQNRNVADTRLKVTGEIAQSWMRVAQCFAGKPEDPPLPGQRVGLSGNPS
jgi:uncharacterized protein (TIGR03084 family)